MASAMGISTPTAFARATSAGAVSTPSASLPSGAMPAPMAVDYGLRKGRATITDRRGTILAVSLPTANVFAVPGKMTSAFLALQLWLGRRAAEFDYVVVPFDEIFAAVKSGQADVGLIIHEGQLTYANEGLVVCEDLGVWWGCVEV